MTGNELAKAIKNCKGKIAAPVNIYGVIDYIYVEKKDLVDTILQYGDNETSLVLSREEDESGWFLETVY